MAESTSRSAGRAARPGAAAGSRAGGQLGAEDAVYASDEVPVTWSGGAVQRPPRLLLTLLGDYWWRRTEPLPSAALVALLAEFGVSDSAARAALSRLTRNQPLITRKNRRLTDVHLSDIAGRQLDENASQVGFFTRA